jgi:hypothetical protein
MTAVAFAEVPGAVAAEFAGVILGDGIGAVVSDDVVGAVAKGFDSACLGEFAGFFVEDVILARLLITFCR